MKIGTSLGKCVKSILAGEVAVDEVLWIISNTMCPDLDRLMGVIEQYYFEYGGSSRRPEYDMSDYSLDDAKAIAQQLFESGKLHQPRCLPGAGWGNAHALQDTWYDIMPSQSSSAAVKEAWDHYVFLSNMTS